jgi:hypothetical protein
MNKKGMLVKTAVVALLETSCSMNILGKENIRISSSNQIPKTIQENKEVNYNDEENWNKIDNYDTNYVKLKDINKESVQEIKVDFTSLDGALFGEISDGYIVVGQEKYDIKDKKTGDLIINLYYKNLIRQVR